MAEVHLKHIRKTYLGGKVAALAGVTLKVPDGVFATVLGPSGCGKTTLLRVVAGLESPDSGEVFIGGKVVNKVPPGERNIAMVFQSYALYPHKKVFENIAIGLRFRGYPKGEIAKKVDEVGKMLQIGELMDRFPRQLSGGQQQRVALARALVREPESFLLDEPLSNLDAQVRDVTRTELKKLFKGLKATVLYVTHDQAEAMRMSDLVVVMDTGTIRQIGDPTSIYEDPAHKFVAEFIGSYRINMFLGRIERNRFISADGSIIFRSNIKDHERVFMGIRPEHIHLDGSEEIRLQTEVVLVEPMGAMDLVSVRVRENEFKVLSEKVESHRKPASITFIPDNAYFFDVETGFRLRPD